MSDFSLFRACCLLLVAACCLLLVAAAAKPGRSTLDPKKGYKTKTGSTSSVTLTLTSSGKVCMYSINKMQIPRSPNIAELGLALFSSWANINKLEIDVTPPRLGLLFAACRRGPNQMADRWQMDGIQRHRGASEENVASTFIGYVDMHQTNLNVRYLWHRQDPLIDDDVLIDNMWYIVRGTLRDLYTEYTTGALPTDHLQFLETYPSQVLESRVWCETVEADCIRPGWVMYLQGSIWFDLGPGTLQRNPLGFRWTGATAAE